LAVDAFDPLEARSTEPVFFEPPDSDPLSELAGEPSFELEPSLELERSFELELELVPEDESVSVDDVDPPDSSLEPDEPASTLASPPDRADDARVALEARSFFAQPLPLKWTAGVLKPFRSVPSAPQAGQKRGPSALMPWMTSVTRPHALHT
jgi:hypothetical protein